MIRMLDAIALAQETIQSDKFRQYGLKLSPKLPIRLPGGWRFPYDSFAGPFRVRHSMIIFQVSDDGKVWQEWNDFDQNPHIEELDDLFIDSIEKPLPTLPPVQDVLPEIMAEHSDAIIETSEAVWVIGEDGKPDLAWRIGLVKGIERFTVVRTKGKKATLDRRNNLVPFLGRTRLSKSAAKRWDIGRARFRPRSGNVTIRIKELLKIGEEKEYLRNQWLVWACMAHMAEFVEGLGFNEFGPHDIRVEFLASSVSVEGAAFNIVQSIPTISFLRGEGWAEASSIVLHEFGHALWAILYARPPIGIDSKRYEQELDGIQEGFCDYLAATLLSRNNKPVIIGGELKRAIANRYKLPRIIDGIPIVDPDLADMSSADEHLIGHKWVNFLFDLRQALQDKGQSIETADCLILRAHLTPLPGVKIGPPMESYLDSLKKTAENINLTSIEINNIWQPLAEKHAIL